MTCCFRRKEPCSARSERSPSKASETGGRNRDTGGEQPVDPQLILKAGCLYRRAAGDLLLWRGRSGYGVAFQQ